MGKRILKSLTHYGIWQFGIAIFLSFYLAAPFLAGLLSKYITFDFFQIPKEVFLGIVCILIAVVYFIIIIKYEIAVIYRDKTHGRNYYADSNKFRRSWSEMVDFFKKADKYRIDPKTLPEEDWRLHAIRSRQKATKACEERPPEQRWISDTHMVACSAYDDPSFHINRREKS